MRLVKVNLTLKFLIGTGVVLVTTLGVLFYILIQRQERLIHQQVENEAKVLFRQIVLTRQWIADHGGIFVEVVPWTKSGRRGDEITDETGRRFTRKTPAMVTKDLSKYAKGKGLYWFHITSLKLMNPENAPDEFERESLVAFEQKKILEESRIETTGEMRYFRYIAPLFIEPACLKCHDKQGYKVGDVRGAISVTVPMEDVFAQMKSNRISMFLVGVLTTVVLLAALYLMMNGMVLSPLHRLNSSIKAFASGVRSFSDNGIRTGDELEELSNSFSEMARTLGEYHANLEERIEAAVKDLAETNGRLTEANARLIEMNRKKSDFVAKASHELRTPLTSIKGAMDYISARLQAVVNETEGDAAGRAAKLDDLLAFFDIIKKNAERLIRMVNDLLDLERIEQGGSEMHFLEFDISALIGEVVMGLRSSASQKRMTIEVETEGNPCTYADEDRIKQVVINLLSNAVKYGYEGSTVQVRAVSKDGSLTVVVTDSGPGVPLEDQERIFERFFTAGDKKGTGLGLAISKGIIEAHGGRIGVASDGATGSSFFFRLLQSAEVADAEYGTRH